MSSTLLVTQEHKKRMIQHMKTLEAVIENLSAHDQPHDERDIIMLDIAKATLHSLHDHPIEGGFW